MNTQYDPVNEPEKDALLKPISEDVTEMESPSPEEPAPIEVTDTEEPTAPEPVCGETTDWKEAEPAPKKTNKNTWIILGVVGFLILGSILAFGIKNGWFGGDQGKIATDPKDRVIQAIESLVKPVPSENEQNTIGSKELIEAMKTASANDITLTLLSAPALDQLAGTTIPSGITLHINGQQDLTKKQVAGVFGLGFKGSDLLAANFYFDEKKAAVSVPALFKAVLQADLTGDLDQKLANAPLLKSSGMDAAALKEFAASLTSFKSALFSSQTPEDMLKQYPKLDQALTKLKDSFIVTKLDPMELPLNGQTVKADGFKTVISEAAQRQFIVDLKDFALTDEKARKAFASDPTKTKEEIDAEISKSFDDMLKTFDEKKPGEITFNVYMTKQNELLKLSSEKTIGDQGYTIAIDRMGGSTINQNMTLALTIKDPADTITLNVKSEGTLTGQKENTKINASLADQSETVMQFTVTQDMDWATKNLTANGSLTVPDTDPIDFEVAGTYQDIVKGKSFTTNLSKIKLSSAGQELATMSLVMKSSAEAGTIAVPAGSPTLDLLTATQADIDALSAEIQGNFMGLFMQLAPLMGQ